MRGAILFLLILLLGGCGREDPAHPNLVLVTVDRMAADRLDCFGGAAGSGGSICALGREGVVFAWATTPGEGEASSAATVLTGLTRTGHGIDRHAERFLASAHETIAEDLSRAGYATAAFVASPRLNRSRRFDQGFDVYDDRFGSPSRRSAAKRFDLSETAQSWIRSAPSPWFVWIHADRDAGVAEVDRLVARITEDIDRRPDRPGIVFAALRGESTGLEADPLEPARSISWRTHRIPLIWRPPPNAETEPITGTSDRLASLLDIAPTLRAAASLEPSPIARNGIGSRPRSDSIGRMSDSPPPPGLRPVTSIGAARATDSAATIGRNLDRMMGETGSPPPERFLLLEAHVGDRISEVGLASSGHLYVRRPGPLDGSGKPAPIASLVPLGARFAPIRRIADPTRDSEVVASARLEPGPWREDILDPRSPVPRLEVHLARLLQRERKTILEDAE